MTARGRGHHRRPTTSKRGECSRERPPYIIATVAGQSHHYVPRMYLSGFFDRAQVTKKQHVLWRYRPGGRPTPKGLKKVAEQTDFYDLPELGEDNDIEEMLSQIEHTVAPHLKKVRAGQWPFSPQEKAELSFYIALQYTRTPWFRELANQSATSLQRAGLGVMLERAGGVEGFLEGMKKDGEEIKVSDVESLKEFIEQVVDGSVPMEQQNKAWNAKVMLQHAERMGELFAKMRWTLLKAPTGSAFVTSDVPTSMVDPAVLHAGPEGYKPSIDAELYFPVSPRFLILGDRRSGADTRLLVSAESVKNLNCDQMRRCQEIYASLQSDELQATFDSVVKDRPPSIRELPADHLKAAIERKPEPPTAGSTNPRTTDQGESR